MSSHRPFSAIDPTTGETILYAPQRAERPVAPPAAHPLGNEDAADCPFCPGRESETPTTLHRRPMDGPWRTRAFPNRYPVVVREAEVGAEGHHEVIVDTPRHGLTFADDPPEQAEQLFLTYRDRMRALRAERRWRTLALFRNQGHAAGASQFHSHTQLVALAEEPPVAAAKLRRITTHAGRLSGDLLGLMIEEAAKDDRALPTGESDVVAWVPSACRFAYGVWLAPARPEGDFGDASDDLAAATGRAFRRLLRAFGKMFPGGACNLVLHSAPGGALGFRWHWELAPRLTGVAGFELGSGRFVNTVPPTHAVVAWRRALS